MRIRSFIAVNLPQEIKEELGRISAELRRANAQAPIKWVQPEILHLTLHFLGDLDEQKLALVEDVLADSVRTQPSFRLKIDKFDCFPNPISPRIIFAGCREAGGNRLMDLQSRLGRELRRIGLEIDVRPWQSHITLARLKAPKEIQIPDFPFQNLEFQVKSIDLMKSELSPEGPFYTILKSFPLKPLP